MTTNAEMSPQNKSSRAVRFRQGGVLGASALLLAGSCGSALGQNVIQPTVTLPTQEAAEQTLTSQSRSGLLRLGMFDVHASVAGSAYYDISNVHIVKDTAVPGQAWSLFTRNGQAMREMRLTRLEFEPLQTASMDGEPHYFLRTTVTAVDATGKKSLTLVGVTALDRLTRSKLGRFWGPNDYPYKRF